MSKQLLATYRECRENQTCYIVGQNALGCLKQARRVILARTVGLEVRFEPEQGYWMDYVGDIGSAKTWERRFESGTHEVLFAYVESSGEVLSSLGGIVVSCDADGREYLKAIELELLDEAVMHLLKETENE